MISFYASPRDDSTNLFSLLAGSAQLEGREAHLGVHLIFLIGFCNKLAVLLQSVYAYCTYKRGARIITGLSDEAKQ